MADPHIQSPMDTLDHLTVIGYRLGLTLCAPSVLLLPWALNFPVAQCVLLAGVLCAASLHIYAKSFRLLLQAACWSGLVLFLFGWPLLGLGAVFITLGGLCFKEQFCFNMPLLKFQPFILAALWLSLACDWAIVAKMLATLAALLFLQLSVTKWRMPSHYDIGDKTKYEI